MDTVAIGVDIGGTKIAFVLANRAGDVLAETTLLARPADGEAAVLDRIAEGIDTMIARADGDIAGVGIGCPGHVDTVRGVVRAAVNLNWTQVALLDAIRSRLKRDLPLWLHKDANAGALGEMYYGAARGVGDFVLLTIGTGLGGSAVANGQIVTGANFFAHEVGHISLDPNGRQCACGLRGCVETYISGIGLHNSLNEQRDHFPVSPLAHMAEPTTADMLEFARRNDPLALAIIAEAGRWLGTIMAVCATTLNPARIVIGGGLGHAAADLLLPRAEAELERRVLPMAYEQLEIVPAQVTNSALGAAALVWHQSDRPDARGKPA